MKNDFAEVAELINLQGHIGGSVECECRDRDACLQFGCAREQIIAQYDRESAPKGYAWKDAVLWLLLCAVGAGAAWAWRVMA